MEREKVVSERPMSPHGRQCLHLGFWGRPVWLGQQTNGHVILQANRHFEEAGYMDTYDCMCTCDVSRSFLGLQRFRHPLQAYFLHAFVAASQFADATCHSMTGEAHLICI